MSDLKELYDELENQLEQAEEYAEEEVPMYSGYSDLVDNHDAIKEELVKYSRQKTKQSRYYSRVKSSLIYTREIQQMDVDTKHKAEFESKINYFRNQFETIAEIIKNRLYTINDLIESTRSLQSHIGDSYDI